MINYISVMQSIWLGHLLNHKVQALAIQIQNNMF